MLTNIKHLTNKEFLDLLENYDSEIESEIMCSPNGKRITFTYQYTICNGYTVMISHYKDVEFIHKCNVSIDSIKKDFLNK